MVVGCVSVCGPLEEYLEIWNFSVKNDSTCMYRRVQKTFVHLELNEMST